MDHHFSPAIIVEAGSSFDIYKLDTLKQTYYGPVACCRDKVEAEKIFMLIINADLASSQTPETYQAENMAEPEALGNSGNGSQPQLPLLESGTLQVPGQ